MILTLTVPIFPDTMPNYTLNSAKDQPVVQGPMRLESSAKTLQGLALKAQVHDALWMITQQNRVGEFKASDGGSLLKVRAQSKAQLVNRVESGGNSGLYDHSKPIEAVAEKLTIKPDLRLSMQMGKQWFRILRTNGVVDQNVFNNSLSGYPISTPTISGGETADEKEGKCQTLSDLEGAQMRSYLNAKIVDGWAFYNALINASNVETLLSVMASAELSTSAQQFIDWFQRLYYQPGTGDGENWQKEKLEYSFKCSAPVENGASAAQKLLLADQYSSGTIDWYSFDLDPGEGSLTDGESYNINENILDGSDETWDAVQRKYIDMSPGKVKFKGMPVSRWWEYEDKGIDLAGLFTNKRDILKMMLMDFGLVYSNDWFVMPVRLRAGALHEMEHLLVKDVFGKYTRLKPSGDGASNTWQKWTMYSMNKRGENVHQSAASLYVAPNLAQLQEGPPVEQVSFIKDEMANMVWGIEKYVQSDLGEGIPGKEAHDSLEDYFIDQSIYDLSVGQEAINYTGVEQKYRLSNEVPENWIPFIPVKKTGDRDIMFQRAAMNRILNNVNTGDTVKPRSSILNHSSPYTINEEEILRTGTVVTSSYQRTRWYNGKIVLWKGHRRSTGYGEGDSGLRFDYLTSSEESDFT